MKAEVELKKQREREIEASRIALQKVVEVNFKVEEPGKNNVHNNTFYAEEELLRSELQAMRDCNPLTARHWIVRNTRNVNRTGQLTGFKLVPGSNCLPLAGSEAKFLRRAAFLKHNLWVTPYAHDEMYPGGEFPNQNPRVGEGLATWVKQNRSLEEADIVLWYVFGVIHIPRLEDWPVMPVDRIGFMLMDSHSRSKNIVATHWDRAVRIQNQAIHKSYIWSLDCHCN